MKVGLIGLPQSGKTTVFEALTSAESKEQNYSYKGFDIEEIKVPDGRLDFLAKQFEPGKVIFPKITFVDMKFDMQQIKNGIEAKHLKDVDELVLVTRLFENETVPHPLTDIDALRDIDMLNTGILLSDMELMQKRIEKIEEEMKKGVKDNQAELDLLNKLLSKLEEGLPIRKVELSKEKKKKISGFKFLSQKPFLIVLNVGEEDLEKEKITKDLQNWAKSQRIPVIEFCAELEKEITQIDEEERVDFMKELGIGESARDKFIRATYENLDLISFFTVKGGETRAWSIKKGTTAWEAAGKIHSDIQQGFVKAEVVHFNDFKKCSTFKKAKEEGVLRTEGKEYIVKDGDIINFKFNI